MHEREPCLLPLSRAISEVKENSFPSHIPSFIQPIAFSHCLRPIQEPLFSHFSSEIKEVNKFLPFAYSLSLSAFLLPLLVRSGSKKIHPLRLFPLFYQPLLLPLSRAIRGVRQKHSLRYSLSLSAFASPTSRRSGKEVRKFLPFAYSLSLSPLASPTSRPIRGVRKFPFPSPIPSLYQPLLLPLLVRSGSKLIHPLRLFPLLSAFASPTSRPIREVRKFLPFAYSLSLSAFASPTSRPIREVRKFLPFAYSPVFISLLLLPLLVRSGNLCFSHFSSDQGSKKIPPLRLFPLFISLCFSHFSFIREVRNPPLRLFPLFISLASPTSRPIREVRKFLPFAYSLSLSPFASPTSRPIREVKKFLPFAYSLSLSAFASPTSRPIREVRKSILFAYSLSLSPLASPTSRAIRGVRKNIPFAYSLSFIALCFSHFSSDQRSNLCFSHFSADQGSKKIPSLRLFPLFIAPSFSHFSSDQEVRKSIPFAYSLSLSPLASPTSRAIRG
ncbi:hypothetical protein C7M84_006971, partial [Penaeus vannamei]